MFALCTTKPGGPDDRHPIELLIPGPRKIGIIQLLFGSLIMLPQIIVAYFYGIYVAVMYIIGLIGVITGGKWAEGKFNLVRGFMQHMMAIAAYATWLTDVKPPIVPAGASVKIKVNTDFDPGEAGEM